MRRIRFYSVGEHEVSTLGTGAVAVAVCLVMAGVGAGFLLGMLTLRIVLPDTPEPVGRVLLACAAPPLAAGTAGALVFCLETRRLVRRILADHTEAAA